MSESDLLMLFMAAVIIGLAVWIIFLLSWLDEARNEAARSFERMWRYVEHGFCQEKK